MEETEKMLVGSYVYSRTMLLFRVHDDALQRWLAVPYRGKSLFIGAVYRGEPGRGFLQRSKHLGLFGQSSLTLLESLCPLQRPVQTAETDQPTNAWYRAYAVHPEALVGWRAFAAHPGVPAQFSSTETTRGLEPGDTVTEHFEVRAERGDIELDIEYERGPLQPHTWHRPIVFAADPSSGLFYKNQEFRDYITGSGLGSARLKHLHYRIAIPELEMFDGTEKLVSVTAVPWSRRQVYRL